MAVPTGSGTETIHAHHFDDVDNQQTLIFGVKHHVYTVLSVIVYCITLEATTDVMWLYVKAHSGHQGTSGNVHYLTEANLQVGETFVWNDKFSFNGAEPSGTNALSASEQVAIAAQSGSAVQELQFNMTGSDDGGQSYDVHCTYLDQDWT